MRIDFTINNSTQPEARYVTWAPSPLRLRLLDAVPSPQPVQVTLVERRNPAGGSIRFSTTRGGTYSTRLTIPMPTDGQSVTVYLRGEFGKPSTADGDVSLICQDAASQPLGLLPLMVRIRKNANRLTSEERDRFIAAMAQLNNRGMGRFADFRSMHVSGLADDQAHAGPGFLPWHRAYLLDLERELQLIDPSIALPYWRFDQASPNLFNTGFMGVPDSLGAVQFGPSHPFLFWATDGEQGIKRRAIAPSPGTNASPAVQAEPSTLAAGPRYAAFRRMQGNPHGAAHVSYFGGSISSISTAAKDPLFFLLHCNVDRLWAKWQVQNKRFDPSHADAYAGGATPTSLLAGHNLQDSLWPWNGVVTPPRPPNAPGGDLSRSACVDAPGPRPLVSQMIDFQGQISEKAQLGFSYDDVRLS